MQHATLPKKYFKVMSNSKVVGFDKYWLYRDFFISYYIQHKYIQIIRISKTSTHSLNLSHIDKMQT